MPQVTVYVRDDDLPKWKGIKKKSEFLHEALNRPVQVAPYRDGPSRVTQVDKDDIAIFVPKPPNPNYGYPCCQKARPCKHWSYDGRRGVWVNELTGKTKEVPV